MLNGDNPNSTIANATDEIAVRNFQDSAVDPAMVDDPYDHNRDGLVNEPDQIIARGSQTNPLRMLPLITPPVTEVEASGQAASLADVDWLYQFEQTTAKRQRAPKTAVEQAVDRLLAVRI